MHVKDAPKGVIRVTPDRLSPGDVLFISTPSTWELVRSSLIRSDPPRYEVRNKMCPDPYWVYIPNGREIWALKRTPWGIPPAPAPPRPRQQRTPPKPEPEPDFRSYWNWDPKDERAAYEYSVVEEREWQELKRRWQKEVDKKAKRTKRPGPQPKAKKPPSFSWVPPTHLAWYNLLGVTPGVTPAALKKAYKKAAFRWHPDRCKRPDASEMFKKVSEAYAKLTKARLT